MKRVVFVLFFVFLCSGVFASSGVSPPSYDLNFEPNLSREFIFDFIADDGVVSELFVVGDLASYVSLDKTEIVGRDNVVVTLNLPEQIDTPGVNIVRIAARQSSGAEGGIGVTTEVRGLIRINVPYPGKYVGLSLNVPNANVGEEVNLSLNAKSLGKEDVSADILIQIFKNDSFIDSFNFGSQFIKSGESADFFAILNTENYVSGNYVATALAYFDGDNYSRSDVDFRLGELRVDILNYTKILEEDKINRFDIGIESFYNNIIDDFHAEVFIIGADNGFSTSKVNLDPWEKGVVYGYLDTNGLEEENVRANITLYYGNKTTSEIVDLNIVDDSGYVFYFIILGVVVLIIVWVFRKRIISIFRR